jgi:hypothetical protein
MGFSSPHIRSQRGEHFCWKKKKRKARSVKEYETCWWYKSICARIRTDQKRHILIGIYGKRSLWSLGNLNLGVPYFQSQICERRSRYNNLRMDLPDRLHNLAVHVTRGWRTKSLLAQWSCLRPWPLVNGLHMFHNVGMLGADSVY